MKHNSQDYLLAIWELCESYDFTSEKGVAERLKVSLPSAWEGIHRLEREGMLVVNKKGMRFTEKGYLNAMKMVRAHRITEYFVYSYLEVPWDEVHDSVMDLEHDFTEQLLSNLYRKMGSPGFCPHGNPIRPDQGMIEISAAEAPEGKYYFVRPVLEDYNLLKKLLNAGSTPGKPVTVERGGAYLYLIGENGEYKLPSNMERTVRLRSNIGDEDRSPKTSGISIEKLPKVPFPLSLNEPHS
ncbi:MAG: metal-dependent transcriptional regulator [Candidatus Thermoplasmatota archaeon]|nr:metal-dependent transcriptional regulator [Candidatus Thermoplasmatota archaeon]MCL5789340.1 metal-dependent transcriptional regulator [Candidatus Thermoplasmatota archaeon]